MYAPFWAAGFSGLAMHLINSQVFRHSSPVYWKIGAAAGLGYAMTAMSVNTLTSSLFRKFDKDITVAFERRYMQKALSVCGLTTSYTHIGDNEG